MFKSRKNRPEPPAVERTYSSIEVSQLAEVSLRQLQWWDERKVVSPRHEGHRRVYGPGEVIEITVIAELRRKGFSLQKIRRVLRFLQREMGRRLAAQGYVVLVPNPFYRSKRAPVFEGAVDFNNPDTRKVLFGYAGQVVLQHRDGLKAPLADVTSQFGGGGSLARARGAHGASPMMRGIRKRSASTSGAWARTSSRGRQGWGTSSRSTLASGNGWAVGGTSAISRAAISAACSSTAESWVV